MTPDKLLEFHDRLIAAAGKYGHEHGHEFERILDEFAEQIRDDVLDQALLNPPLPDSVY